MYNIIVNPLTGRKVKINGKLGIQIIRNYISQINYTGGKSCGIVSKQTHGAFAPLVCSEVKGKGLCDYLTCKEHDCFWLYDEDRCGKITQKRLKENISRFNKDVENLKEAIETKIDDWRYDDY